MGAIKSHSTPTTDTTWDGPAAVADAPNDAAVLRYMHAWVDSEGDDTAKASYKFPHHAAGTDTAANLNGVRNGLARLEGSSIPEGDKSGVKAHLQRHLDDAAAAEKGYIMPSLSRAEAAAARGEAAEQRAHALAQEGRSVPVLRTSERFRTQLRVVRSEMPRDVGAARMASFAAKFQRAGTVTKNGKELAHLAGYATVFGVDYEMWDFFGPYDEQVKPGAADATLAAKPDTVFLVNHKGMTMARTTNGTLELAADEHGMSDDAYLNPARDDIARLLTAVDDELIDEQSFAFMIMAAGWNDAFDHFTIYEFDINRGDVSAVNYGANPYTSISARAQELIPMLDALPVGFARAAFDRLARRTDLAALRVAGLRPHQHRAKTPSPERRDLDLIYVDYDDDDADDDMMACPQCGAPNAADAKYCDQCGASMAGAEPMQQNASTPRETRQPAEVAASAPLGRRVTHIEALLGDDG